MVLAAFILNLLATIGCGIGVIFSFLRLIIVLGVILTGSINGNVNGGITIQMLNNTNDPYSTAVNGIVIAFVVIWFVISIIYFVGNLLFTIFSYKVYKNKMKNNLIISILDLIFGNVISGILLIIDFADKKEKGEIN